MPEFEHKSTIIERIQFQTSLTTPIDDHICFFQWLPYLNCYIEGTLKSHLKFKSLSNKGECLMHMPSQSIDRIQTIQFCEQRLMCFVASRDGKL